MAARAFASELKREKTSQRTHEHLMTKARCGLNVGGRVYGYENVEIKEGDRCASSTGSTRGRRRSFASVDSERGTCASPVGQVDAAVLGWIQEHVTTEEVVSEVVREVRRRLGTGTGAREGVRAELGRQADQLRREIQRLGARMNVSGSQVSLTVCLPLRVPAPEL